MSAEGPRLILRLLGRFEALRDGEEIPPRVWGRRKTETLLKVLLTTPGRAFSQDQLIEALFDGEAPERARSNLFGRLSELRHALEPTLKRGVDSAYIHRRGDSYTFALDAPCWIDTVAFDRYLDEGNASLRHGQLAEAITAYENAVALHRGEFLETDRYAEWALDTRRHWENRYITALTKLADAYASANDRHRAVMACRTAFDLRPSQESLLQKLMVLCDAAGARSEALLAYKRGVDALKRDLDVVPSPETEALRSDLLKRGASKSSCRPDRSRVAVLPLVNVSPDPEDEYFADGMTEELIYALSKVSDLKVIAQTSSLAYKNTRKPVTQIGRELNIGSLVEGSVRKAGEKIRITIQLIDVRTEEHLWAHEYDRAFQDVFTIQADIAREVSRALSVELLEQATEQLERPPTASLEAYTLYLKGRHSLRGTADHPIDLTQEHKVDIPGVKRAATYFERAIAIDADYALAWSGLADACCLLWFFSDAPDACLDRATEAASRAVGHGPLCGEAHASLALVKWIGQKDIATAEPLLRKATLLSPRNPILHRWYARLLRQLGRRGEALLEMLQILEIDPLSPTANLELADLHWDAGRCADAITQTLGILELDPSDVVALLRLAKFRMLSWDWKGAEEAYLSAIHTAPRDPAPQFQYAEMLLCLGRRTEGERAFAQGVKLAERPFPPRILECIAVLCYLLDDFEQALQCFGQARNMVPRIRMSYWWTSMCHWRLGNYVMALEWLNKYERVADGFFRLSREDIALSMEWASGLIYASKGDRVHAEAAIARAAEFPEGMPRRALGIAGIRFHLGDLDEGFFWLQQAVKDHCVNLQRIQCYGLPLPVVEDPRYTEILGPIGLAPGTERTQGHVIEES